jgi:hypothetical protein
MRAPGEGEVFRAQQNKRGQGEEPSLTSDLDRQKEEQRGLRNEIKEERAQGQSVDGGAGGRMENEGLGAV